MLELWGGHECTVNRTRTGHKDQSRLSGHDARPEDLDLFASLGIKAIRYPVLWERVAPNAPDERDFSWSDERLARLRELGVRPIVGLVHHGSGPSYTNLLDPGFAAGLADYAAAVAERYTWIEDWTPVNEPLTTARFSALYGHWYPHVSDEGAFWTALLNQIDATRLAMRAIRAVNPKARLVQTEDMGRTYATSPLKDQAQFDNLRRWMSFDLLCGKVTRDHPLWKRLMRYDLAGRLDAIAADPCPPDVIGINHYLTSDRFLDHRLERYPPERRGGSDVAAYADVEAVRVLLPGPDGLEGALRETHARYGLPMAVTEVHNGCTREEQMRWLLEAWRTAGRLRDEGLPIEAITAWSLLGAYDWDSLLTRNDNRYEPGVFDLRGGAPRKTALADLMVALSSGEAPHPIAEEPGWWRRDLRLEYAPVSRVVLGPNAPTRPSPRGPFRPLLIAGATGALGQAFARACQWRGLDYVLTDRSAMDLCDEASITAALDRERPWAVINATGFARVDDAEADPEACHAVNAQGAVRLAAACGARGLPVVAFSSALVFDGRQTAPYEEEAAKAPLNVYGRSKAEAEDGILALDAAALIVRSAAFFSAQDPDNFAAALVRACREERPFAAADNVFVSPTHTPELVNAALDLLIDGETGVWNLANEGEVSWAEFAAMLCKRLDLNRRNLRSVSAAEMPWTAPRPERSALTSRRGAHLSTIDRAVDAYARQAVQAL
jgi:dTDP-4-dehydrorhamnose reductase